MLDFDLYANIVRSLFLSSWPPISDELIHLCHDGFMSVIEAEQFIVAVMS